MREPVWCHGQSKGPGYNGRIITGYATVGAGKLGHSGDIWVACLPVLSTLADVLGNHYDSLGLQADRLLS